MVMPAIRSRWVVEDVRALNIQTPGWPRYELIDGELLVTPSPGSPHQVTVAELYRLLYPYVEEQGLGLVFFAPADVELRKDAGTQPDLYVLPYEPGRGPGSTKLLLVAEVISPGSVRTDRITKRDFYLDSGVAEYWIVDSDVSIVERWTALADTPRIERATMVWQPTGASRPLAIELPALFRAIQQKSEWARRAFAAFRDQA